MSNKIIIAKILIGEESEFVSKITLVASIGTFNNLITAKNNSNVFATKVSLWSLMLVLSTISLVATF